MKKRIIKILICYAILFLCVIGIIMLFSNNVETSNDKINIITCIFPEYDFVKKVGGDKVEVTLLLNSGVESHTYEPSVRDMKNISDSDIFVYTGSSCEPWADTIIDSLDDSDCIVVDSSKNVDLIEIESFETQYNVLEEGEVEESENLEDYEYDGHIWLSPKNAIKMIDTICEALCEYDPDNSEYYLENAESYKAEIEELDIELENAMKDIDVLVFGGEFAYTYFIEEYDLKYVSVYSSCGEEAEPSVSEVRNVIDYINENNITKVFYQELSEGTVAKMISEETNAEPVIFYSLHNVSSEQIEAGESYVSIMRKNLENIVN